MFCLYFNRLCVLFLSDHDTLLSFACCLVPCLIIDYDKYINDDEEEDEVGGTTFRCTIFLFDVYLLVEFAVFTLFFLFGITGVLRGFRIG
mmetsp:Transcript_26347/g.43973  ORF Transcript_26347/g.43973 Transcript_26347/m.43973 type:complete len:90 (+) Transcript_26347:1496-1765(+)